MSDVEVGFTGVVQELEGDEDEQPALYLELSLDRDGLAKALLPCFLAWIIVRRLM